MYIYKISIHTETKGTVIMNPTQIYKICCDV